MLEIKTVPIEIQMKVKNASLEYSRGTAEMEISRSEAGIDIKSRPIRLRLDTFESRGAAVHSNLVSAQAEQAAAQGGQNAGYKATAAMAQTGSLMLNATFAPEGQQAEMQQLSQAGAMPAESMQIRYEMDKLNFDWKFDKGEFKFTPGDIEISVEQRPDVVIKYVGGPIYVPRSSDPNYTPVDVKA